MSPFKRFLLGTAYMKWHLGGSLVPSSKNSLGNVMKLEKKSIPGPSQNNLKNSCVPVESLKVLSSSSKMPPSPTYSR